MPLIDREPVLCTDEAAVYAAFARISGITTRWYRPNWDAGLPRTLHGASIRTTLTAQSVKAHYLAYTNRLKKLMLPQSLKRSAVSMRYVD